MIIGFGGSKGGTGKTTSAEALAGILAYHPDFKLDVGVIDIDVNRTYTSDRYDDCNFKLFDIIEEHVSAEAAEALNGLLMPFDSEIEVNDHFLLENIVRKQGVKSGVLSEAQQQYVLKKFEKWKAGLYSLYTEHASKAYSKLSQLGQMHDVIIVDFPGTVDNPGVLEMYGLIDRLVMTMSLSNKNINGFNNFLHRVGKDITPIREKFKQAPLIPVGLLCDITRNDSSYTIRKESLKEDGLKGEFGVEFVKEVVPHASAVFGRTINTSEVLQNDKGKYVYHEPFLELIDKLEIFE